MDRPEDARNLWFLASGLLLLGIAVSSSGPRSIFPLRSLAETAHAASTAEPAADLAPLAAASSASTAWPTIPKAEQYLIGTVIADGVAARTAPRRSADVVARFGRLNPQGAPQVFLLEAPPGRLDPGIASRTPIWYRAQLPIRPNGTFGYLPADRLEVRTTSYRIEVDRARFTLELWSGFSLIETFPVGIGKGSTPTPVGDFYLVSLLRPPTANSIYGSYAYGLSAYSDKLTDWEGGGVIGLHGTTDPTSVGRPVSHGCIRMRNDDIEKLVPILPLGTPISIT